MSRPTKKRREKKAQVKKKRVSQARVVASRIRAVGTILKAGYPDLKLRHKAIKPYDLRVCGDCQVCCHAMRIEEIDSLKYENCEHQCELGCNIHHYPPKECVHFECTWKLEKLLKDQYRPDRCGFMMYAQQSTELGRLVLVAIESYERAWQESGIYAKLAYVAHKLNMLILYLDKENKVLGMYGPPDLLKHAQKVLDKTK